MKMRTLFVMFGVVISLLGCTLGTQTSTTQPPGSEVGTMVATALPEGSNSTPASTQFSGTPVSFEYASFVIPTGLASGANPESVPAVGESGGAPWEVAPAHLKLTLTGYALQNKFHQPQILVYPADEFAQANSNAAEQIDRLKQILVGGALLRETLPLVPFFNAGPLITAQIKLIPFQSGRGVWALTEYAQYAAPINNHELFYHFQGLTGDNKYYVIAILPVTTTILAEDEKPEAPVPTDGVPIPTGVGPNDVYYASITEKLNSLSPESYTPSLDILDALIQSILVTNP